MTRAASKLLCSVCMILFALPMVASAEPFAAEQPIGFSSDTCEVLQQHSRAKILLCKGVGGKAEIVQISFSSGPARGSDAGATAINVVYKSGVSKSSPHWDRLWVIGNRQRMSAPNQQALAEILKAPSRTLRASGVLPLVDVLVNLVQPGDEIGAFDRRNIAPTLRGYTMICEFVGKEKLGSFHAHEGYQEQTVMVGLDESGCYGRCGPACGEAHQYTQECLNHDLCNRTTGQNMGICKEEFWAAADGYISAPDCF